jgi:hypothetical protein
MEGLDIPSLIRMRKHIALFLEKLGKASDCYESMFAIRSEARKAWANAQIALGAGLSGGLIASTIIPFAQRYGSEKWALATAAEITSENFVPYLSQRRLRPRSPKLRRKSPGRRNVSSGTPAHIGPRYKPRYRRDNDENPFSAVRLSGWRSVKSEDVPR